MSGKMNADMKTWVDAAISIHLRDGVHIEDIRQQFIGKLLAQMLLYYRYDVPREWEQACTHTDLLSLGKRLADGLYASRSCSLNPPSIPEFDVIYRALEQGSWQGYSELSASVWHMVTELSGLAKEDWELLPSLVAEALSKAVVCTRCGYADTLSGFGEVVEYADPFTFSGGTRIHLRCRRCGEKVIFEPGVMQVEKYRKRSIDARTIIIAGAVAVLLLALGLFRHIL